MPLMDISENDAPSSTNGPPNRRQSGRTVRAPQKFVPDAPSSQSGSGSGKRKRSSKDAIEDVENDISEESESEVEEISDEEEVQQSRKKAKPAKKPVAKKVKVNGTTPQQLAPAVKLPNRAKKPKKVVMADVNADGLYGECAS
jgi:cohesin complex subunit SA-1/2